MIVWGSPRRTTIKLHDFAHKASVDDGTVALSTPQTGSKVLETKIYDECHDVDRAGKNKERVKSHIMQKGRIEN